MSVCLSVCFSVSRTCQKVVSDFDGKNDVELIGVAAGVAR